MHCDHRGTLWVALALLLLPAASPISEEKFVCPAKNDTAGLRELASSMFHFGWSNYLEHAYPLDELDPIHCTGRGADANRENININDVLGNFSLTAIDGLDTLAIMGDSEGFEDGVRRIIETVSFDHDVDVQVFEVTASGTRHL